MRRLLILRETNIAASNLEIDVAAVIPAAYRNVGPLLANVSFWVHAPYIRLDPENEPGGGWEMALLWLDGRSKQRELPSTPISINDDDAIFSSETVQVNRFSGTSLLKLVATGSNVGTARVSYSLVLLPSTASDLIYLP